MAFWAVKAAVAPVFDEMLKSTSSMVQFVDTIHTRFDVDRLSMVVRCGGERRGIWTGTCRIAARCPDANACLPGTCADETSDYS